MEFKTDLRLLADHFENKIVGLKVKILSRKDFIFQCHFDPFSYSASGCAYKVLNLVLIPIDKPESEQFNALYHEIVHIIIHMNYNKYDYGLEEYIAENVANKCSNFYGTGDDSSEAYSSWYFEYYGKELTVEQREVAHKEIGHYFVIIKEIIGDKLQLQKAA